MNSPTIPFHAAVMSASLIRVSSPSWGRSFPRISATGDARSGRALSSKPRHSCRRRLAAVHFAGKRPPAGVIALSVLGVVADRLDGAALHGLLAESLLLGGLGLLVDIGVTAILVALEVGGCGFAAKIAIDALVVAVVGSCDILGILVGYVGHSDGKVKSPHPDCNGFFGPALPKSGFWSKSPS